MKNILFVLPWLPYPKISGGHQAIFYGIKALVPYMNVYITYQGRLSREIEEAFGRDLNTMIKVFPFSPTEVPKGILYSIYSSLWKVKQHLMQLFKKTSNIPNLSPENWVRVFYPLSEDYINHVNSIIKCNKIDIVQCEMLGNLSMVLSLPNNVEKIFVHHEIGFVKNGLSLLRHSYSSNSNAYLCISKLIEIALLNKYDKIITLSEIDKEKLIAAGVNKSVYSSYAIVDTTKLENPVTDDFTTLTFVGPEFHTPNYEGLLWFLENCWNSLKNTNNSYKLNIIGNWSEKTKSAICSKYSGVTFLGFVDKLSDALAGTIMIVPIMIGSGIRMKILEAASMGVPFISTSVGAEGLPMENDKDCYISDSSSDFVKSIIRLRDKDIRFKFSSNSRLKVEKYFSFKDFANNRISIYNS